jgi:hypothetical protein
MFYYEYYSINHFYCFFLMYSMVIINKVLLLLFFMYNMSNTYQHVISKKKIKASYED